MLCVTVEGALELGVCVAGAVAIPLVATVSAVQEAVALLVRRNTISGNTNSACSHHLVYYVGTRVFMSHWAAVFKPTQHLTTHVQKLLPPVRPRSDHSRFAQKLIYFTRIDATRLVRSVRAVGVTVAFEFTRNTSAA